MESPEQSAIAEKVAVVDSLKMVIVVLQSVVALMGVVV